MNNSYKTWTSNEEEQLLLEISNNKTYKEIANIHMRTVGAISSRISLIAYNMYCNGIDITDISQILKKSNKSIDMIISKRRNKERNHLYTKKENVRFKIEYYNKKMNEIESQINKLENYISLNDIDE